MKTSKAKIFNRMMIFTVLALFCIPGLGNASGVIKGRVLDTNNQPVQYATATLINPENNQIVEGDMCDNNGEFIIENVNPGDYILSVRNLGFEKNETTKVIVSDNDQQKEIPVQLKESVCQLPELQVVSKRYTYSHPVIENTDINS